jgi:uncharacterized membrane protein
MHTSLLAFESPAIASICSLVFAILIVYAYILRLRCRWVLWGAAGWMGFSIYFGLLAVSAGVNPQLGRAEIVLTIRVVLLLTYIAFVAWGVFWVREVARRKRARQ